MSDAESPLWVGLVDASFDDGPTEDGMVGAFMWVICRAESVEDFERRVTDELASHEATPTEFNDVELVAQRSRLSRDLRRLVHDARSGDVALGTWHRYREGDE